MFHENCYYLGLLDEKKSPAVVLVKDKQAPVMLCLFKQSTIAGCEFFCFDTDRS